MLWMTDPAPGSKDWHVENVNRFLFDLKTVAKLLSFKANVCF